MFKDNILWKQSTVQSGVKWWNTCMVNESRGSNCKIYSFTIQFE